MAKVEETGTRPNTSPNASSSNTPRTTSTGTVGHETETGSSNVKVFDSNGTTNPTATRTATTTPGTWRADDEDLATRSTGTIQSDPAPATRRGASMVTTIIMLIVILLLAYFVFQWLF